MTPERTDILQRLSPEARKMLSGRTGGRRRATPTGRTTGPLSKTQERIWIQQHLLEDSSVFHFQHLEEFRGPLEVRAFLDATNRLCAHHAILRTRFVDGPKGPQQSVVAEGPPCALVDATGVEAEELREDLVEFAKRNFCLAQEFPLRWRLIKRGLDHYLFQAVVHQIGSDRLSRRLFRMDLTQLYNGVAVKEPALTSIDFAIQEREAAQAKAPSAVAGPSRSEAAVTFFPTKARSLNPSRDGRRHWFALPDAQEVRDFANAQGITTFALLLGCLKILLYKTTGRSKIEVGNHASTRSGEEFQDVMGCFVRPVLVETELAEEMTVSRCLKAVARSAWQAVSAPQDSDSRLDFGVIFDYFSELDRSPMELRGIQVNSLPPVVQCAEADTHFQVLETQNEIRGRINYNLQLYTEDTIEALAEAYRRVLDQCLRDSEKSLSQITLAPQAAPRDQEPDDPASLRSEADIAEAFLRQVEARGDAVAIVHRDGSLSYRELESMANRLSHRLRSAGVEPGDIVAIEIARSLESVVAQIAVIKLGAIFLALEPSMPELRRADIKADCRPSFVLTAAHFDHLEREPTTSLWRPQSGGESGAYLIYTSGSTGKPRGVLGTHQGVINRAAWMAKAFPFESGELVAHKTALSFVDSLWEVFGPLLHGSAVLVLDQYQAHPERLLEECGRYGATRLVAVPSLIKWLLDSGPDPARVAPKIKTWIASGEVLAPGLVEAFHRALPQARLLNLYGSTEVAGDVLFYDTQDISAPSSVPIGSPIEGHRIAIVSPTFEPLPAGIAGQLCVTGAQLALGYFEQDSLTRSRFRRLKGQSRGPLYFCTGDLAVIRDGVVHYLGRQDQRVKLLGHRAEMGEIEALIERGPDVSQAVVLLTIRPQGPSLAAFVVAESGCEPEVWALKERLSAHLPLALLPSRWRIVAELPRTHTGKLDHQALLQQVSEPAGPAPVQDQLINRLCAIWSRLLGAVQVDAHTDFFALGGDSLLAISMFREVEREMGLSLPAHSLYSHSTVAELADLFRHARSRCVAPFRPGATGRENLLFVHGWAGGVELARGFAQNLAGRWWCHGLAAPPFEEFEKFQTLEQLVSHHVEELITYEHSLPKVVLGFSSGGVIAFELARQLHRRSLCTPVVILLDSYAPEAYQTAYTPSLPRRLWIKFKAIVGMIKASTAIACAQDRKEYRASILRAQLPDLFKLVEAIAKRDWTFARKRLRRLHDAKARNNFENERTHAIMKLLANYRAKEPYQGRVILYRASFSTDNFRIDPHQPWRELAQSFEEVVVPLSHSSIMKIEAMDRLIIQDLEAKFP